MARTSKNNVAANTAAAKNQKPKATAPKAVQEAMFTMEEVENLMAEKGLSFEPIDDFLPEDFTRRLSNEIINKVKGVNRVCYDISSKPPSTIEGE